MKKFILLFSLFLSAGYSAQAGFILHPYYENQEPQGYHNIFVVVTLDNGKGMGEIYQSSGMLQVGDGSIKLTADEGVIIALDDIIETPEVNTQLQNYFASKGIDGTKLTTTVDFSVFCDPEKGAILVSRNVNAVDRIEIRNMKGELLKAFPANLQLKTEEFDISDLQPGNYIVALKRNENTIHTVHIEKH